MKKLLLGIILFFGVVFNASAYELDDFSGFYLDRLNSVHEVTGTTNSIFAPDWYSYFIIDFDWIHKYNTISPFNIDGAVFEWSINPIELMGANWNFLGLDFYDDWNKILIAVSNRMYEIDLATPYDILTWVYNWVWINTSYPAYSLKFSNLGLNLTYSFSWTKLYQLTFNVANNITYYTTIEASTYPEYVYDFVFNQEETQIIFTQPVDNLAVLRIMDLIEPWIVNGWVIKENIKLETVVPTFTDIYFINDWEELVINNYYWDSFIYHTWHTNSGGNTVEQPTEEEFFFYIWGYTFFENWFSFNSFIPDPYGWLLTFDIIAPNPTGLWTINITTDPVGSYETTANWYWFWGDVIMTIPYHTVAGTYEVRPVYTYQWIVLYPLWEDYDNYPITLPEEPAIIIPYSLYDLENWFFNWITDMLTAVKRFFTILMKIWDVEPKEWGFMFIPTTHAFDGLVSDYVVFNLDTEADHLLADTYNFLKWFIIFAFLILWVILILIILKRD